MGEWILAPVFTGVGSAREKPGGGEGVHQGRPYGGRVRWRKGGGQVSNLPLGSCRTRRRRATTGVVPKETGSDGERRRAGLKPAPTEKGLSVGGVVKMGPRMREDDGRGKAVRELPLRGSRRTRRRRATTRVAPTETGVRLFARKTERGMDSRLRGGWDLRGNNGG